MTKYELNRLAQLKVDAQALLDDLNSFEPYLYGSMSVVSVLLVISNVLYFWR